MPWCRLASTPAAKMAIIRIQRESSRAGTPELDTNVGLFTAPISITFQEKMDRNFQIFYVSFSILSAIVISSLSLIAEDSL